jgi:hypothetical protein
MQFSVIKWHKNKASLRKKKATIMENGRCLYAFSSLKSLQKQIKYKTHVTDGKSVKTKFFNILYH